jgi:hypothetical protein
MRLLGVLALALVVSCGGSTSTNAGTGPADAGDEAAAPDFSLTMSSNGQTVAARVGQTIVIRLGWIGSNDGYDDPTVSSAAVTFVGATMPRAQNPGGPTVDYHFLAASAGSAVIQFVFRGQDGGAVPAAAFSLTVNVSN